MRPLALALAAVLWAASLESAFAAASGVARHFDIPAGSARTTLNEFARQSGEQLIFVSRKVSGISTRAIRGEYTPMDALSRMLEGTMLEPALDEESGLFSVNRVAAAPGSKSSPSRELETTVLDPFSVSAAKMNPFETTIERNNGFQSANAGMGSRLSLDLRETPVPYSIINRDLIDALQITDLREAAGWATGQTFVSTDNGQDSFGTPQQYIARGIKINNQDNAANFGNQRNFYQDANFSSDSYAVESFDFGRGPNAALFGSPNSNTGGLGGVSSSQTKRVRFDRSQVALGLELGQWGYRRATVDINEPVTERFGIRANAVIHDQAGWRYSELSRRKGLTVTSTYRITPTIDVRIEASSETSASHNVGSGFDELVSGWDGMTVFRGPVTNAMLSSTGTPGLSSLSNPSFGTIQVVGPGGLTFNGEPQGVVRVPGAMLVFDQYSGQVMNYQNTAYTRRANATSRVPLWSRSAPNGQFFLQGTNISPLGSRFGTDVPFGVGRSVYSKQAMPADMFDRAIGNSRFRIPDRRFEATIDTPAFVQNSKDLQVTLGHQLRPDLYFEIGGDANRNHNVTRGFDNFNNQGALGFRNATIDLNLLKPDGSPNPHFLDVVNQAPFVISPDRRTSDQTLRVNLGYIHDAGDWGDYDFNLNIGISQRESTSRSWLMSARQNADPRAWGLGPESISLRAYWSDPVRAFTLPPKSTTLTNTNWDNPENPVIEGPRSISPAYVLTSWDTSFVRNRYALLQTTARYFKGFVVFTGAFRRDFSTGTSVASVPAGDLPTNWDGQTIVYRPDAPADYWQLTYVSRNPTTGAVTSPSPVPAVNRPRTTVAGLGVRNPIFAADRFRTDFNPPSAREYGSTYTAGIVLNAGAKFAPFFNYSNTYTPGVAESVDLLGSLRKPVTAFGMDFGGTLNFFNGRFSAKIGQFINVRQREAFTPATTAPINALFAANTAADPDLTGRNARGALDLASNNDYQSTYSRGFETEISANNIVPGWRLTLNGGDGWRNTTNRAPLSRAFIQANAELFRQILEDAGGSLDTSTRPTDAPSAPGTAVFGAVPAGAPAIDQTNAINAYNNLWVAYHQLASTANSAKLRDTPTINFFSDYTIQSGPLRNLRLGAGIQWQGRIRYVDYGNQTILDPNAPVPTAIDDPRVGPGDFFYLKGSYSTQGSLGYAIRLKSGSTLVVGLRINNLLNNTEPVFGEANTQFGSVYRQPNGDLTKPNRVPMPDVITRFPEPINFRLSTTLTFGGRN